MPAQAAVEEGLDQQVAAEQAAPVAEAAASEGPAAAASAFAAEGAIPEVGKPATQIASEPTASDKAYGTDEVTPADRDFLIRATQNRMAAAIGPFVLACSNRREELHQAITQHPHHMLNVLGQLAFGKLVPGVNGRNTDSGAAMTPSTTPLVNQEVGHFAHMTKVLETVGKIPAMNFKLNFGAIGPMETSEEFVGQLAVHVGDANEAMRNDLDGHTNEELAALSAAFDPKSMTVSVYEEHLDRELSKISLDAEPEKREGEEEELDAAAKPTKELAYVGDPGEGDQNKLAIVEKNGEGEKEHKVVDMVPDEMKEMAISKHGEEPGTLYQDSMYRR